MGHRAAVVVSPPAAGVHPVADLPLAALLPAVTVRPVADHPVVGDLQVVVDLPVADLLAADHPVVGDLPVVALPVVALPVVTVLPAVHLREAMAHRVALLRAAVATDLPNTLHPVADLPLAAEALRRRPINRGHLLPVAVAPASKQARPSALVGTP
jgi:hypothetical protein